MTSRERIRTIIAGQAADRCGFWLGSPHADTWPIYHAYFGTKTEEELRQKLGDDFRWICPQWMPGAYRSPDGRRLFDTGTVGYHAAAGPLAECETVADLDRYPWPKAADMDFASTLAALDATGDLYRASGLWTCYYHNLMDLIGIEEYFIKMHTHPAVVEAATDRVCQFYYDANERFFREAGDRVDAFFFGNDFGTQRDLMCSPAHFAQFVLPWARKFAAQARRHHRQVILHSCGSIWRVIDPIIDAGVQCLHPLQALATGMDAASLAAHHKGRIAFLGGIDTQDLLVNGSPAQVRDEVRRVKDLLGPCVIISPSHEALLPNIPPQNVAAMAAEATR